MLWGSSPSGTLLAVGLHLLLSPLVPGRLFGSSLCRIMDNERLWGGSCHGRGYFTNPGKCLPLWEHAGADSQFLIHFAQQEKSCSPEMQTPSLSAGSGGQSFVSGQW